MSIIVLDTFDSLNRHKCVSNRIDFLVNSNSQQQTIILSASNQPSIVQFKLDALNDGKIYKDLSRIIKRYVSFDFSSTDLAWVPAPNSTTRINVYAVEYTGTTGATVTTPIISSSTIENSYLFTKDWQNSTYKEDKYKVCVIEQNNNIQLLQNFVMHVNCYDSSSRFIQVKTYGPTGGLVSTYQLNGPTGYTTQRYMIDVGTFNLAQQFGINIFDNVASYTVQMIKSASTPDSLIYNFKLQNNCNRDVIRIHWLNSKGGFDSLNFFDSKETRSNETNTYERKSYSITSLNKIADNTLNKYSYYSSKSKMLNVVSDWLTNSDSIIELFESPVVIMEDNNKFYSVSVDSKSQERKTLTNNYIISYEVQINLNDIKYYTI